MRIHRTPIAALAAAIVLAVTASPVLAQGAMPRSHPGPQGSHGHGIERLFELLDLTDDQRVQVEALRSEHQNATESLRDEMRSAHETLAAVVHADAFDETLIRDAAAEAFRVETELVVARARHMQDVRAVLTPEQVEKLRSVHEMLSEMRPDSLRGRGPRPHGHGMPGDR